MNIRESLGLPDQPGYGLPGVPRVPGLSLARHNSGGGFSSDLEMDAVSIGSRSTVRATANDAASDVSSVRTDIGSGVNSFSREAVSTPRTQYARAGCLNRAAKQQSR